MKSLFLIWAGAALLILATLAHNTQFLADFKTGIVVGVGLVVLVLYPAYLRNHERRLAALERSIEVSDTPV